MGYKLGKWDTSLAGGTQASNRFGRKFTCGPFGRFRQFLKICTLKKAGKPRFSCLLSFFWAFSGLFLIFVPFYSKKQGSRRDKKGTSFWKCPRNAQMVSPTLQISPGFFSLRGTKFPKPPENAQPRHTSLSVAAARSSQAATNLPAAAHKLTGNKSVDIFSLKR